MTYLKFTAAMTISALALMLSMPQQAAAKQIEFELGNRGHKVAYHYKWQTHKGDVATMSFTLDKNMVRQATHEFQPYDNDAANTFVYDAVSAYAKSLEDKGINMTIQASQEAVGRYEIKASGASKGDLQEEMGNVNKLIEMAREQYFENNFYRKYDENSVVPDHARIASLNYRRMRPVAMSFVKQTSADLRERVNYVLSFLQSIPYDELMSRENSNGSGFATPVELLTRNRADCDSKSVALAGVLRNIYPQLPMVLVLIPGHAFVGIGMRQGPEDFALRIKGRTFVLAEPVGPALMPLGTINKRSEQMLRQGEYTYVSLPGF